MQRASLLFAASLLSLSAACGGVVVFDDGGSGGSGGASSSSSVTPTTGPGSGPTSSVVSTSTGPMATCDRFCDALAGCLGPEDCLDSCASVYEPGCEMEADALLDCFIDAVNPATCDYQGGCEDAERNYQECVGVGPGDCQDAECFGSEDQCGCTGFCQGLEVSTSCTTGPNGNGGVCQCFIQEELVGTCNQPSPDCGLQFSCCQGLWFGFDDGPPPPPN